MKTEIKQTFVVFSSEVGKEPKSANQIFHDRIPISLLELSSSKIPSGGLLYNRILARHTSKCVFKIYKWTAESLNSLCDLTSAVNPVNILTD